MGKMFGTLVAASVAGMLASGGAMAQDQQKAKDDKGAMSHCKSNSCAAKVEGAKNSCSGHMACAGIKKEACTAKGADGKPVGTWMKKAKPADSAA